VERIPYVQRVRKNGRLILYFRRGAFRRGPLPFEDGSPELRAEVERLVKECEALERTTAPRTGTIGGQLDAYKKSAEFRANCARVQREYEDYCEEMKADFGEVRLSEVDGAFVRDLRDAWAARGHAAANMRVQVLKNALEAAMVDGRIEGDPFARIRKVRRPHDAGEARPMWEDAEVTAAIEACIETQPGLARAIALGRWGGFRRGGICQIPLAARVKALDADGEPEQRLYWITPKRKVLCDKREDPRLTVVLARTPSRALTIAYNSDGFAWKERALSHALDRLLAKLAAAGKVRAAEDEDGNVYCPLSWHGLRHARGVELARAGASDAEIMSQLEQASEAAARIYRRQAERRRMADSGQNRLDRLHQLRSSSQNVG
jgi:hypothetical protein